MCNFIRIRHFWCITFIIPMPQNVLLQTGGDALAPGPDCCGDTCNIAGVITIRQWIIELTLHKMMGDAPFTKPNAFLMIVLSIVSARFLLFEHARMPTTSPSSRSGEHTSELQSHFD